MTAHNWLTRFPNALTTAWNKVRKTGSNRRSRASEIRPESRPELEALEARQLLTNVIATPAISAGWQTTTAITVPAGKTTQIPFTDSSSAGTPLTYSVTSSNPNFTATVHTGNTFIDLKVTGGVTGEMVFELFNDLTPNTASYISSFVQSGFYNNIIFHRVVSGFVAQAGDPGGTGSYGPFNLNDEFNINAIYNGNGQLGMARQNPHDTNSTQFFITQGNQQDALDFKYTLFGQLVSGFGTFNSIMSAPTSSSKPITPITIQSATVIQDTSDAVIMIKAAPGTSAGATTTISVTTSDGAGATSPAKTFQVQAVVDSTTYTVQTSATTFVQVPLDPPFLNLNAIPQFSTTPLNTTITIPVSVTDINGSPYTITAHILDSSATGTVSVTQLPGSDVIRVTPASGYTGQINVEIQVSRTGDTSGSSPDAHDIVVAVGAQPVVVTGAAATFISGSTATGTVATFTDADTSLTAANFSATINWGNGKTATAGTIVKNSDGSFSVNGSHLFAAAGNYTGIVTISSSTGAGAVTNTALTVISPNTAHYQAYVSQLYIDLLGRSVDAFGLASWVAQLNGGKTYADVAVAITSSREYDGIVVDKFYFDLLGRHAEAFGLNSWVDQMQTGLNAEVIRAGILGSDEYYNRTGPGGMDGNDTTFITALYETFLNRTPDDFGLAGWMTILNHNPANRQTVARGISNSDENRTVIITGFYQTYLHRDPDAGGLATWKGLLAGGISQPQIISSFVTSPEYLGRLGITG